MTSRALRVLLLLLAPVALVVGIYVGGHPSGLPRFARNALLGDQDTRVVDEAIGRVRSTYYRRIPRADLANAAVSGIVKSLDDRFSNYFSPAEYKRFKQTQDSQIAGGIGVSIQADPAGLRVLAVYDGSPAARAGIKVGDVLTSAGGTPLKGKDENASSALIKGPRGTDVRLGVRRRGARDRVITLTRAIVSVPQVETMLRRSGGKQVGVVSLAQFGSGAHAEVYAGIEKVVHEGAKALVFDLRNNGGGLVSEAQLIASAFLQDGPIVTTRGRDVATQTLKATGDAIEPRMPLVVLVNEGTASASEIVTGALQDRHRAEVVGTRTFGKGVFQEVIDLSNGGALDITAGQYFTPSGRNLGGKGVRTGAGITPDLLVKDDPRAPGDEQLRAALAAAARAKPGT